MSQPIRTSNSVRYENEFEGAAADSLILTYVGGTPTALANLPFTVTQTGPSFVLLPNDEYRCTAQGLYLCMLNTTSATGTNVVLDILHNTATVAEHVVSSTATRNLTTSVTKPLFLNANDTVSLYVATTSAIGLVKMKITKFS